MASVASPYGLKPVNELGGTPYAGATRSYLIDPAGTASSIYNGSPVYVNASGYLAVATATGADATTNGFPTGTANTGIVGVFVGCSYINAQGQVTHALPRHTRGVLEAQVQGTQGLSPYARWVSVLGLWPWLVLGLATLLSAWWVQRRRQ